MQITELLATIRSQPSDLVFTDVLQVIDQNYSYTPVSFSNGIGEDALINAAGTNQGSCKVFAFARMHQLSESETLACFAEHYRDVLADPNGESHGNIRRFMRHGWKGITFEQEPLEANSLK